MLYFKMLKEKKKKGKLHIHIIIKSILLNEERTVRLACKSVKFNVIELLVSNALC